MNNLWTKMRDSNPSPTVSGFLLDLSFLLPDLHWETTAQTLVLANVLHNILNLLSESCSFF